MFSNRTLPLLRSFSLGVLAPQRSIVQGLSLSIPAVDRTEKKKRKKKKRKKALTISAATGTGTYRYLATMASDPSTYKLNRS